MTWRTAAGTQTPAETGAQRPAGPATGRAAALVLAMLLSIAAALVWAPGGVTDSAPLTPADPRLRSPSRLTASPTAQHDGVAWQSAVIGNTVYVVGKFNNARPFGAAPGTQLTARANILAFDITTGRLISGFAPVLNAQALAVAPSPDGSRLYIGGDFTPSTVCNACGSPRWTP